MNVLKPHLQTTIWTLLRAGNSQREIERRTGISRHTIRAWAKRLAAQGDPPADSNCPGVATDPAATVAGREILVEVGALARCDVECRAHWRGLSVLIAPCVNGSLYLDHRITSPSRHSHRERQRCVAADAPSSIRHNAFAALVPSLDEVVVHIHR